MNRALLASGLVVMGAVADACAFEARVRFAQRVADEDITIDEALHKTFVAPGGFIRLRVQLGVFDDAESPAPAGGIIGWATGSIQGSISNMPLTRTPGRLAPFQFSNQGHANGYPISDPFTRITEIDNTLGIQVPLWPAGSDPGAPPLPTIFGRNEYVSVYEISLQVPTDLFKSWRTIDLSGLAYAASDWRAFETPIPPTPDSDGLIRYAPVPLPPLPIERSVRIFNEAVPSPPGVGVLLLPLLCARRRRY
jgi:hypothetical protein